MLHRRRDGLRHSLHASAQYREYNDDLNFFEVCFRLVSQVAHKRKTAKINIMSSNC